MQKELNSNFGKLTLKDKKLYDISQLLNSGNRDIDILFNNSVEKLEKLTVIDAERKVALENLRTLTAMLQTKRLRNKVKSKNKYFTL